MRSLLVIFLLFSLSEIQAQPVSAGQCAKLLGGISGIFSGLEKSRKEGNFDALDSLSNRMYSLLSSARAALPTCSFSPVKELTVAASRDKNLILFSWDTYQGGTMKDYTTVAFFRGDQEQVRWLRDTAELLENTLVRFDTVFTVEVRSGEKLYLAYGEGQGATSLPWQKIQGFRISGNTLDTAKTFAQGSSLLLEYDLTRFSKNDKPLKIKFRNEGKVILVPEINNKEVPTGNYVWYEFDGEFYRKKGIVK